MSVAYHGSKKCPTCDYKLNANKEYLKLSYQAKRSVDKYLDTEEKLAIIRQREEGEEFHRSVCEMVKEIEKADEEEEEEKDEKGKGKIAFRLLLLILIIISAYHCYYHPTLPIR